MEDLPSIQVMVGSAAQLHDQVGRLAEEYYAATWPGKSTT